MRAMSKGAWVIVVAGSLVVFAAGACSDDDASAQCVDFAVRDDEVTCTVASDCTSVESTRVCSGDPTCGAQIPTNQAGRARYDRETGMIPRTRVQCKPQAPMACVAGQCVVCHGDCPDAG